MTFNELQVGHADEMNMTTVKDLCDANAVFVITKTVVKKDYETKFGKQDVCFITIDVAYADEDSDLAGVYLVSVKNSVLVKTLIELADKAIDISDAPCTIKRRKGKDNEYYVFADAE